ncbi:MAG: copper chaperone PCu(A)C [Burkholderiaceae bacterium]|nr:MAG: copper chaperone PCu(A)C [Burkholderiaceae bacterium]
MKNLLQCLAAAAVLCAAAAAPAHVVLPAGGATAGSSYEAAFAVGHACQGAQATTELSVQLPAGFRVIEALPRPGWALTAPVAGAQGGEVRWTADSPSTALHGSGKGEFIVRGVLPSAPGVLYFPVRQVCDVGQADWVQVPRPADTAKLSMPAARLDLLPSGVAPVDVKNAWVRATVPGQHGAGAFMVLQAPMGARLVGAATPAAGVAEIHEMKMDGDTMRMRPVTMLELPERQPVALSPGGYHLMLMDLKEPLVAGRSIALTLQFEDKAGIRMQRELNVEVKGVVPDGKADHSQHKH